MSIDPTLFDSVCNHARQAMVLQTCAETLEWDEQTGLPSAAGEYRAQQVSMLRSLTHQRLTDPAYGEQLKRLSEQAVGGDPASDQGATVTGLHRDWQRNCKLPTDLVEKLSVARVRGQQIWAESRKADDFRLFQPALEHMVDLKREAGQRMAEDTDRQVYEALLDEYEPDASVDQLQKVFDDVRGPLVKLIAEIKDAPQRPKTEILKRAYPIANQRALSREVAEQVGFDFNRGSLDETLHPFCTTLGPHDCRILTRYEENWLPAGLFATLHEAGHGMYEQGLRTDDWFGLPPGSYVSLGFHESQSRLWENQVGRGHAFWRWLYPQLQDRFPAQLNGESLDDFHFAINTVEPSLIRVEADEATYNLHILIRFDLERQLIDGSLSVADLPSAWHDRYESDLGIRAASDADGVLQDVHWSAGLFGYFPTYTLGNLVGAQLFAAASRDLGDLDELIGGGEFSPLLDWMRQRVHKSGRCVSGPELVEQATGSPLSADYLIDYLQSKLRPLYGI